MREITACKNSKCFCLWSSIPKRPQVVFKPDNVNDHRAAAIDLQAEKPARPAAPCASYCYPAVRYKPTHATNNEPILHKIQA